MADSDFSFGGVSIPSNTKRIYVTAILVPSTGDPRIQPTGFPDIGPVLYPDPSGENGQICLIESEASMANRLEEVAVANKYTGTLVSELAGLPYLEVLKSERFMTASTIDGHRFASEYIMKSKLKEASGDAKAGDRLVDYVKRVLEGSSDDIPAANVPRIFRLAMELDPLALIHGFQVSLKGDLTFVGLRSPRALTACVVGLNAQPVGVPGVRIDPIGTGDAGQAIFRKERIVAETIQANFAIDIGLLMGLAVEPESGKEEEPAKKSANVGDHRRRLLVALSLWKVAGFLKDLSDGHRLRTECDLVLDKAFYSPKPIKLPASDGTDSKAKKLTQKLVEAKIPEFPFEQIVTDAAMKNGDKAAAGSLQDLIAKASLPANRSPLTLEYGS